MSGTGLTLAQKTILPETAIGISEVITKRIPYGMPLAEAQKLLEGMGFVCKPGQSNSDFGPVGSATFIDCEHRKSGKVPRGVINRLEGGCRI